MKKTLAEFRPDLLDEWDYELNTDISPFVLSYGSSVIVNWVCSKCGHKWKTSINHRTSRNSGCPVCARANRGRTKTASSAKKNNLRLQYPDLAKEWHPTKNGKLTPDDVSVSSNKKIVWLCPKCGFEYPATVNHRTIGKTACPKCAAQERGAAHTLSAAAQNNFALQFPLLAEEWDYERNGELKPENVSVSSNKRVGWVCSFCGNQWEQSVNKRTNGHGCPKCTKTGTSFSELAILFYLKKEFPDTLHRYIIEKTEVDLFIPCNNTAIEYDGVFYHNSTHALKKENAKDAFCLDKGITLYRIRDPKLPDTQSARRITCVDEQHKHLESAIRELLDLLCPGNKITVDLYKDAPTIISSYRNTVYENSITVKHPELLAIWHPSKNLPLTPDRVTIGMCVKIWWQCPACQQEYQQDINHKIHGRGCPVCAGKKSGDWIQ